MAQPQPADEGAQCEWPASAAVNPPSSQHHVLAHPTVRCVWYASLRHHCCLVPLPSPPKNKKVGQPEIVRLLCEWDADMEEADSIRRGRPLMHAANNGHTSAVKALLECGAEPEATDDNGYTALMVAVFSDRWGGVWVGGVWVRGEGGQGEGAHVCVGVWGGGLCLEAWLRWLGVSVRWNETQDTTPACRLLQAAFPLSAVFVCSPPSLCLQPPPSPPTHPW